MKRFGFLLPHFGGVVDPVRMVDGAQAAEDLGFHSVWARDHLVYRPHGFEPGDNTFLESLATLAFVAGRTRRLAVGTAVAIPTRHPIHLAQTVATVSRLAGPDRVMLGLGSGADDAEFEAIGLANVRRPDLVREDVSIVRRLWAGETVTHLGTGRRFTDVAIRPGPDGPIPILYGGSTPAGARLAGEAFDGWLPGRITAATLERRLPELLEAFQVRDIKPILGMVPITSIDRSAKRALERVNVSALLNDANRQRYWVKPPGDKFTTPEDLAGALIAGDPETVIEQIGRCLALGLDLVVFDLRMGFDEWESQLRLLGEEVLPAVTEDATQSSGPRG